MKRFVAVCTLILCLSFPVLAGHTTPGQGFWCNCDSPESHNIGLRIDETDDDKELTRPDQNNELETALSVLLLWLRLVA